MLGPVEKATFRLPEWEMERLRQESRRQRRPLNAVVIEVIARGLGGQPGEDGMLRALGSLVVRPPLAPYVPAPHDDEPVEAGLDEALEWARGER
jgi:hypothetical protein